TNDRETVVTLVHMEEVERIRLQAVVRDAETEQVPVEPEQAIDVLGMKNGMTHSHRPGLETGDRTARLERLLINMRPAEELDVVTVWIGEADQPAHVTLVGQS